MFTVFGIEFAAIIHLVSALLFISSTVVAFQIAQNFKGGKFTSAIPYLLLATALIGGMEIIHFIREFIPSLHNLYFEYGIQVVQLTSGIFFVMALYRIYQIRYSTEGFVAMEDKKDGRRNR